MLHEQHPSLRTDVPARAERGDETAAEPARAVSAEPDSFAEPAPAAAGDGSLGVARTVRPVSSDDIPRDILARFHQDDASRGAASTSRAGRSAAARATVSDAAATASRLESEAAAFAGRLGADLRDGGGDDADEGQRRASRERISRKHAAIAAAAALRAGRPLDNFFDALAARHAAPANSHSRAASEHRRHAYTAGADDAGAGAGGGRPLAESAPALVGEMKRLEASLSGEAEGIRSLLRNFRA
jgi:cell division septum initiation protein DivIVA